MDKLKKARPPRFLEYWVAFSDEGDLATFLSLFCYSSRCFGEVREKLGTTAPALGDGPVSIAQYQSKVEMRILGDQPLIFLFFLVHLIFLGLKQLSELRPHSL